MALHWITLDGTANTRELGGIPTSAGVVADGVVIRSDNLQNLTAGDIEQLTGEHRVKLVLDLRTPGEVAAEGPTPLMATGVTHHALSLVPDPDAAMKGEGRILPDRTGVDPVDTYLGYLRDMSANVVTAFRLIAHNDGATVVHCAVGKDRTGVISAMLLDVAGANREAVIEDFVATGDVIEALIARISGRPTYAADLSKTTLDSHRPQDRTMRLFLEALDREWRGAAGWLTAHGLSSADLSLLRTRLSGGEVAL